MHPRLTAFSSTIILRIYIYYYFCKPAVLRQHMMSLKTDNLKMNTDPSRYRRFCVSIWHHLRRRMITLHIYIYVYFCMISTLFICYAYFCIIATDRQRDGRTQQTNIKEGRIPLWIILGTSTGTGCYWNYHCILIFTSDKRCSRILVVLCKCQDGFWAPCLCTPSWLGCSFALRAK